MRIKSDDASAILSTGIGYTTALTNKLLADAYASDIAVAQRASPNCVREGGPPLALVGPLGLIPLYQVGAVILPIGIQIHPVSFETKELIIAHLDAYNVGKEEADMIIYTDFAQILTSMMTTMVSTIAIVLTAFAAISLVVSSIMIGIITYVSVVGAH
jgi:putative ABC transport system permease protein